MSSLAISISLLLASANSAKVFPRAEFLASVPASRTVFVPVPTGQQGFTTTVPGCGGTVEPFAIVGTPTGTFQEGTITVYFPPQAQPTSTTYIDEKSNATEVVIGSVLPGTCADYPIPEPPSTGTESGGPEPTPTNVCPEKGCSGQLVKGATLVINAINQVSLLSQNLQSAAKLVGQKPALKRDSTDLDIQTAGPIETVAKGLERITEVLTTSLPRITFLPPLPPGCDSDTVVIALVEFVRIHQALLNILIGRAGLLEGSPIKRRHSTETGVVLADRSPNGFIGSGIALALRALEKIVDTVAAKLISLVPTRSACAEQEKKKLDDSLKESILAYEG